MAKTRRRFKQKLSLQERLALWLKEVAETADALPPGPERDALMQKVQQADVAGRLDGLTKSPGPRPPE